MPDDPEYIIPAGHWLAFLSTRISASKGSGSLGSNRGIAVVWGSGIQLDEVSRILLKELLQQIG